MDPTATAVAKRAATNSAVADLASGDVDCRFRPIQGCQEEISRQLSTPDMPAWLLFVIIISSLSTVAALILTKWPPEFQVQAYEYPPIPQLLVLAQ